MLLSSPIRSAMSYPRPQKSMTYPPVRRAGARSIRVGLNPAAFSQKARVGPAIPAPEINTVLLLMGNQPRLQKERLAHGGNRSGPFEEQLPSLINSSDLSLDSSISTRSTMV